MQPVDPDEIAVRVVRLLQAGPAGRVPDAGGPRRVSLAELAPAAAISGGSLPADWPADWLDPRRATGVVDYLAWCQRSAASDAVDVREAIEGRPQADGPDGVGAATGLVQPR